MKKTKYQGVYEDTPTKDGRKFYYKIKKKNIYGNVICYSSPHYLTAKEAYDERCLDLLKKNNPNKKRFNLVAMDYFDNLSKIRKPKTVKNYKGNYNNHIAPYFDDIDINNINISIIRNWASEMDKKGISTRTKNDVFVVLNNIMNFAIKYHGLETNYVHIFGRFQEKNDKEIKDKDKIRYITLDEFNTFIQYVDDYIYETFFYFAFYTGCRKGEMLALTWEDIDFNTKTIYISKSLEEHIRDKNGNPIISNTKTKKNRTVQMNNTLYEKMKDYKQKMTKYKDFKETWFVFGNNKNLSSTNICRAKDKAFELSGVHRITMHEFRHSHVSLCINEYLKKCEKNNIKIDMYQYLTKLSKRMGHTIDVMLDVYSHLFPTIQDEIVDILDNL